LLAVSEPPHHLIPELPHPGNHPIRIVLFEIEVQPRHADAAQRPNILDHVGKAAGEQPPVAEKGAAMIREDWVA
jgi:hypothetical protein